jgi:hypothetical protein
VTSPYDQVIAYTSRSQVSGLGRPMPVGTGYCKASCLFLGGQVTNPCDQVIAYTWRSQVSGLGPPITFLCPVEHGTASHPCVQVIAWSEQWFMI